MWANRLQFFSSWLLTIAGRKTTSKTQTTSSEILKTGTTRTHLMGKISNSTCYSLWIKSIWSRASFWRSTAWYVSRVNPATQATRASSLNLKTWSGTLHSTTIKVGTKVPLLKACLHFTFKFSKDWSVQTCATKFLAFGRSKAWSRHLNLKLTRRENRSIKLLQFFSPSSNRTCLLTTVWCKTPTTSR